METAIRFGPDGEIGSAVSISGECQKEGPPSYASPWTAMIIAFVRAIIPNGLRLGRSATLTSTAGVPGINMPTLLRHGVLGPRHAS
jgi:hypothetical protein